MSGIFHKECDRCGEEYLRDDANLIFETRYRETVYLPDGKATFWRSIQLCPSCQQDLLAEFYRRGLIGDGPSGD